MTSADLSAKRLTPKQAAAASRIAMLRNLLRESREAGPYPPTIDQLAIRAGELPAETLKRVTGKGMKDEVLVPAKSPQSPIALRGDEERLIDSDVLLKFAAANALAKRQLKGKPLRGTVKQFVADAGIGKPFSAALPAIIERRIQQRALPHEVAELIAVVPSPAELAERLIQVIGSQRHLSLEPLPQQRLLELADCDGKAQYTKRALKDAYFADRVIVCQSSTGKEPAYILREALAEMTSGLVVHGIGLLVKKFAKSTESGGKSVETTLFAARDIAARVIKEKDWQATFATGIERRADEHTLGDKVAWLRVKGVRCFFLRKDIEPHGPIPPTELPAPTRTPVSPALVTDMSPPADSDFAAHFVDAFARVDERTGGRNFVKVMDLRKELSRFSRTQFDAGLRELRIADRFTMESAHGGTVRLTDEERQAGIQEGTSLLVYVSRK